MANLSFNPMKDRQECEPYGYLNLRDAFVNGSIDGDVSINIERYNDVSDPDVLMRRPLDYFEALRQNEYVKGQLKSVRDGGSSNAMPQPDGGAE